jgi:hypothetical protein
MSCRLRRQDMGETCCRGPPWLAEDLFHRTSKLVGVLIRRMPAHTTSKIVHTALPVGATERYPLRLPVMSRGLRSPTERKAVAARCNRNTPCMSSNLPNGGRSPRVQGDSAQPNLAARALLAAPCVRMSEEGKTVFSPRRGQNISAQGKAMRAWRALPTPWVRIALDP